MGAVKNASWIDISALGNTLSSITADIADITWLEENPAGTFTVKAKHLRMVNGGELIVGNSGNYAVQEILNFQPSANNNSQFYIAEGGIFRIYGNCQVWLTTNAFYNYGSIFGKFYSRGNATFRPTIHKIYRWNVHRRSYGATRNSDIWDVDYLDFQDAFSVGAETLRWDDYMYGADPGLEQFKNVRFGTGAQAGNYCINFRNSSYVNDDISKILFEDCFFYSRYGIYIYNYGWYFKNCAFSGNSINCVFAYGGLHPASWRGGEHVPERKIPRQIYTFYEGCTFAGGGARDCYLNYLSQSLIKDCDFQHANQNIVLYNDAALYVWTGNTFAGGSGYNGIVLTPDVSVFWVHALDLTVESKESGLPLENATIFIRQKDGKESWIFDTDSNGKPKTMSSLNGKIILIWKELQDQAGNFTLWSDPGNNTYHEIWIFKQGYCSKKLTLIMNQERAQTVELEDGLLVAEVLQNIVFDYDQIGTLSPGAPPDYPTVGDVEKDVSYDYGAKIGTFKPPAEEDVELGVQYGADGTEFTGEYLGLTGDNLEATLEKNPNLTAQLEESANLEGEIEI